MAYVFCLLDMPRYRTPRVVRQGTVILNPNTVMPAIQPIIDDYRYTSGFLKDLQFSSSSDIFPHNFKLIKLVDHSDSVLIERFYILVNRAMLLVLVRYRYTNQPFSGFIKDYVNLSAVNILRLNTKERRLIEVNTKIVRDYMEHRYAPEVARTTLMDQLSSIAYSYLVPVLRKSSMLMEIKATIGQIIQLSYHKPNIDWQSAYNALLDSLPNTKVFGTVDSLSLLHSEKGWCDTKEVLSFLHASPIDNSSPPSLINLVNEIRQQIPLDQFDQYRMFYDPEEFSDLYQRLCEINLTDYVLYAEFAPHLNTPLASLQQQVNRYAPFMPNQNIAMTPLMLTTLCWEVITNVRFLCPFQDWLNRTFTLTIHKTFNDEALIVLKENTGATTMIYLDLVLSPLIGYTACNDTAWGDLRDVNQWV